jgi:hypothetical protein
MYGRVFIISKPVNGKGKQTLKQNFTCFVFMYTKILNFKCHTNEQRSNKNTNQTLKPYLKCLCLYIILCQKCNLQVQSTNSSITVSNLVFWPCQHVRLCECAIMIVCLVCPRPLLFCSNQKKECSHGTDSIGMVSRMWRVSRIFG